MRPHTTKRTTGRAIVVRLCLHSRTMRLAPVYDLRSQQQVFEHEQKPYFDRETVSDHYDWLHDISAILCDLAVRLVVRRSKLDRKACVTGP